MFKVDIKYPLFYKTKQFYINNSLQVHFLYHIWKPIRGLFTQEIVSPLTSNKIKEPTTATS